MSLILLRKRAIEDFASYGDLTVDLNFSNEDNVILDGNEVSEIKGDSDTSIDLVAPTVTQQPAYVEIDGVKTCFYDGAFAGIGYKKLHKPNVPGVDILSATKATMFVVAKIVVQGNHAQNFVSWNNDSFNLLLEGASTPTPPTNWVARYSSAHLFPIPPEIYGAWKIFSMERFDSTLISRLNDDIKNSSFGGTLNVGVSNEFILGGSFNPSNYSIYGHIGRILIYRNALDSETKQLIRNKLYSYWPVT